MLLQLHGILSMQDERNVFEYGKTDISRATITNYFGIWLTKICQTLQKPQSLLEVSFAIRSSKKSRRRTPEESYPMIYIPQEVKNCSSNSIPRKDNNSSFFVKLVIWNMTLDWQDFNFRFPVQTESFCFNCEISEPMWWQFVK